VVAAACLAARPVQGAAEQDKGLARVNGELVAEADLTRYLKLFEQEIRAPLPEGLSPLEQEELQGQKRRTGLQSLIERRLLVQAARSEYLGEVGMDETVKKLGEDAFQQLVDEQGSLVRATELLSDLGLTPDDYRQFQTDAILVGQLLRDQVYDPLRVSPAEVRAFYVKNPAQFAVPRQVVFRQILFPVTDSRAREQAESAASDALARLEGGADFAVLADEFSADRKGRPGGLHRVFVPEEAGDWLPPVVEGLKPGQMSGVKEVAGGFAVARLEEIVPAGTLPFQQVETTIKNALLRRKRGAALADYLSTLRDDGAVEYLPGAARYGYEPTPGAEDKAAEDE
jgi:parvulin-like peptidyl-prolyl isomerase